MKRFTLVLAFVFFSVQATASELDQLTAPETGTETARQAPAKSTKFKTARRLLPIAAGIGLLAWGAYELGDDPAEGRKNMHIFLGAAAVTAGSVIYYRKWTKKKRALSVGAGSVQAAPALVLSYHY